MMELLMPNRKSIRTLFTVFVVALMFFFISTTVYGDSTYKQYLPLVTTYGPEWTIMVYLAADNNLESAGVGDFLEMSSVGSTSDVRIVVQFDRSSGYDTTNGDWTTTKRFFVTQGMIPVASSALSDLGEMNMGNPATLLNFVQWAKTSYPAEKYALILWNHGGGWMPADELPDESGGLISAQGVSWDDGNGGDYLSNMEISSVLASVTDNGSEKLEMVGLDACLMAMLEVDVHLQPYVVARASSEDSEPNDGWPYDTILADLVASPTWDGATLASDVVTRYSESYSGANTQSALDFDSDFVTLLTATDSLADALLANITSNCYTYENARNASDEYYRLGILAGYQYIDLYDFAGELAQRFAEGHAVHTSADDVMAAVLAAVTNNRSASTQSKGITIYFPDRDNEWNDYKDEYASTQWLSTQIDWYDFLDAYFTTCE